jgi:transcription-repair coupling factor (superfamily II helicase)
MYRRHEEEIDRVAARPDEEYPLLGLHDYLHAPDYYESRSRGAVYRWELSAEGGAVAAEDNDTSTPDVFEPLQADERTIRFSSTSHPSVVGKIDPLIGTIRKLAGKGVSVSIFAETPTQRERLADLLEEHEELVHLPVGWITSGFIWEGAGLAILTDHQIFNRILARPRKRKARRRVQGIRQDHLQIGDFIVHVDYGIGRFTGLEKIGADGGEAECLSIRFRGGDRIYVPLEQMHLVEKYIGKEGVVPQVDKLGGSRWQTSKARAKKAIEDIARELLHVYAEREVAEGFAFGADSQWQKELEAAFPYEETPHQLRATDEIKEDMMAGRPMDRLVCGDVGYGKTEVAIRAAFKATTEGKQVAVLVPTTLLAFQHYNTFRERIERFPLKVEMLSRFVSGAGQKRVLAGLQDGTVDIVIGTHRLLSKDVAFGDLGLLIIDEEHRFGVKHKERLKQMAKSVDVLSLTATPIPRTLYMSLSGLRRISVIDTPPRNRHPVKTEVTVFDEETIHRAITEEVSRDGQVFFVHNRVQSIRSMVAFLQRLLPGVRFGVAHGQMGEHELEEVIVAFMERKYDALVSTMIIESGLDFPNVNTIIVNRADRFGLAQLYQLRGRVGRRERQAFAHFLIPRQLSLTEAASKRLQAMEEFEELGSGYRLAMRDLEIRGAGNVLGVEQHGHVAAVGFEMYCKMLKEAVESLRGEEKLDVPQCKVEAPYDYIIPDTYVADADERMMIYKRLARAAEPDELESIEQELADRFGPIPPQVRSLLDMSAVKLYGALSGVVLARLREPGYRRRARPAALEQAAEPPRSTGPAPAGVPRSARGSNRLRRIAETIGLGGGLGAPGSRSDATLDFAPGKAFTPEQCGRLVETFGARLLFKSGKSFCVTLEGDPSAGLLQDVKNLLQVAYFSSKINDLPVKNEGRPAGIPSRSDGSGDMNPR